MLVPKPSHINVDNYRYGFQGQEKDDEIKGEGNSLNYTFRMHDPRVGRFFAIDPLFKDYPHYTPYSFSGNKVIAFKELEGLEETPTATADVITKTAPELSASYVDETGRLVLDGTTKTSSGWSKLIGGAMKIFGEAFIYLSSTSAHAPGLPKNQIFEKFNFKPESKPLVIKPLNVSPSNKEKTNTKEKINLDTGSVRTLMEGFSFKLESLIKDKELLMTKTAFNEISEYAIRSDKTASLYELLAVRKISVIADTPSTRAMELKTTRRVGDNDKIIFGTGDALGIKTVTTDAKFLSGAIEQGVKFDAVVHDPIINDK